MPRRPCFDDDQDYATNTQNTHGWPIITLPATLPIPGFEVTTLNRNPPRSQKALLATA